MVISLFFLLKCMDICSEIDKLRVLLEEEIDKNDSLSNKKVLELSIRLDKLINEYYKNIDEIKCKKIK